MEKQQEFIHEGMVIPHPEVSCPRCKQGYKQIEPYGGKHKNEGYLRYYCCTNCGLKFRTLAKNQE